MLCPEHDQDLEAPDRWVMSVLQIGACVVALMLLISFLRRQRLLGQRELFFAHIVLVGLALLHYRGSLSEVAVGVFGSALFGAPLSLLAWFGNWLPVRK